MIQHHSSGEAFWLMQKLKTPLFLVVAFLSIPIAPQIASGFRADAAEALVLLAAYFAGLRSAVFLAVVFSFIRFFLSSGVFSFSLILPLFIVLIYLAGRYGARRIPIKPRGLAALIRERMRSGSEIIPLSALLMLSAAGAVMTALRYLLIQAAFDLEVFSTLILHSLLLFPLMFLYGGFMGISDSSRTLLKQQRSRELEFQHLFEYAPIPLWEEDYSRAYNYIQSFGPGLEEGQLEKIISNVSEYFSHIRIVNMNQRAVSLAAAESKEELLNRLDETFLPETANSFIPEIVALSENRMSSTTHSQIQNLEGERQFVKIQWNVLPEFAGNYRRVIVSFIDTTELIRQGQRIEESMQKRKVLIKEIHHRVRNSLSIAYSILAMKTENFSSDDERLRITRVQNRIQTIALLHTRLYMDNEVLIVRVRTYLQELIQMICSPYSTSVDLQIPDIQLSVEQLLPLGLLLGELIFSRLTLTHVNDAVGKGGGVLTIRSYFHEIHCEFSDTFCPSIRNEDSRPEPVPSAVELIIIESLILQLRGRLSERIEHGVHRYDLFFPLREGV